jgi:uncharacterized protein (TIGR03437 family)
MISLGNGQWSATWQPQNSSPAGVTVSLLAQEPGLVGAIQTLVGFQGAQTLPVASGGVLNAVTLMPGPLAPGELVLIKGAGLADTTAVATTTPLLQLLAGASVYVGGAYANLLYADTGQLIGQVPINAPANTSQQILLQRDTSLGVPSAVIVAAAQPAVFTENGSGTGQALVYQTNAAGIAESLADSSNPVSAGQTVIVYCAGLGVTDAGGNASNVPALTIGGVPASITYAGVALAANYPPGGAPSLLGLVSAGLGGLYQIAATVPTGLATGPASVIISSGGQTSQAGVTMMIAGSGSTPAQPSIAAGGVLNAASFAKNSQGLGTAVAPGSIVAIFGTFPGAAAASAPSIPYPNSLGGVTVTLNGTIAPLQGVAPGGAYPFITAQVPFEVETGTAQVVVTVNGQASQAATAPIVASAPGIFTDPANGEGNAILVYTAANGAATVAAPVNAGLGFATAPIPRGTSGFFYVTGLGALTPPVADGAGGIDGTTHEAVIQPVVTIGGVATQVSYYGPSGYPGVYQINIAVPQNAPTGAAIPLVVMTPDGSVISNTATVAIM